MSDADTHDFIEVSQMMGESKMEDYLVIESADLNKIRWGTNYGQFGFVDHDQDGEKHVYEQYLPADLYIPKSLLYPKVKFTEAEKKEFDWLKGKQPQTLRDVISCINEENSDYGTVSNLFNAIYEDKTLTELDFARAWNDESLIEVIPEKKWNVKIFNSDDAIYWKKQDGSLTVATIDLTDSDRTQFTAEELKHYGLDKDIFEKIEVQE